MKIPVEGYEGMFRDTNSGAIINMGSEGAQHSANRARMKAEAERLNELEQDVSEIKDMLKQLIER
jgi:hypothetical protein|tara:strand:+ start:26 stop:220 length:195 start_codon:yes stop_codon:yes gene_type:complete